MIDRDAFFGRYDIGQDDFEQSGLSWSCLEGIYSDYLECRSQFDQAANVIAATLQQVTAVHSIKYRTKAPDHLIKKIIRKGVEGKTKYIDIGVDNYKSKITDLIGVRALHLFKEDWLPIHQFIAGHWKRQEKPVANVRKGDPKELLDTFRAYGCKVVDHPAGYRSIHYIIKHPSVDSQVLAEIQVRTIFEEGWSEIDHYIRYPEELNDPIVNDFLVNFNRLAGAADEMGSFVKNLKKEIESRGHEFGEAIYDLEQRIHTAETSKSDAIKDSKAKDKVIEELRTKLKRMSVEAQLINPAEMENFSKSLDRLRDISRKEQERNRLMLEQVERTTRSIARTIPTDIRLGLKIGPTGLQKLLERIQALSEPGGISKVEKKAPKDRE